MQQMADWLESLGMSEYAERFAESDIDTSVLRDLTDQDLKELGVSLGHRRKMLRAVAELGSALAAPSAAPPVIPAPIPRAGPPPPAALAAEAAGERRYLTVMFCDLVGSTGISAQLDAEEWRDLVSAYLEAASAAVTEMGGHVAKKLGDGLMALFGYPVALENDAERAARAALSIQRALAEANRKNAGTGKPELNARIGIETGPVVVDAAGEIYGDAPNIASRVQALAEPGSVVVTARVQRQVAGLFIAEEHGTHTLKGVPEPIALFKLVRASGGGRRAGQRHLTPLVGRDEEIAMLMRRWERARQGEGQLVLIVGEPGLGKSRLVEEFRTGLRETPHTWAEWSCSQLLQNTPLHPIADWGRQRFGSADVSAEKRLADLENLLGLIKLDPGENAALLAPLFDIPVPPERALALPPEELRRRQLAALTSLVMTGARAQPAVLALEDLHWADPTTLDLLRGIAERGALAPLFVLITARPECRAPWGMRSHHGTISLAPLDRHQVRHMVGELAARHALPKEVIDGVSERTGGVPLFVEEVTRLLLEGGEQGGIQGIPPTLQQSLSARLDRLGPAREVAQIGAVIGRDFSYGLLRAVAGMEDAPLQTALERLAEADILLVQGLPPDADYRFKHALIQDAAYENLLKSRRQVLHRRVGDTLRDKFISTAAAEPELLAYHFTQAGMTEAAIEWWGKAGQRSLERSALAEAAEQFTRALARLATLPGTPALRREQIKLQAALITPLVHVKGYSAPETQAAVEQARLLLEQAEALGEPPEDPLLLFSMLYGVFISNIGAFNGDACRDIATQTLELAEKQSASFPRVLGHNNLGGTLMYRGEIAEARTHFDQAIALYNPDAHRPLATRFGEDQIVPSLIFRSWALWLLGYPEAALRETDSALKNAREIGQAATLMFVLHWAGVPLILCGDYSRASALARELGALADETDAPFWKLNASLDQSSLFALNGDASDAAEMLASGITAVRAMGLTLSMPWWLSHLAIAHAKLGELDEAWRCIGEAMSTMETTKEKWCEAEANRIAGGIALKAPQPDAAKAQDYFERALVVARQQQAKSWELRAAMSMARLWRDWGKTKQARELLAPVYGWFTEGFDTLDLKEAKALLDALAP
jgi:class 3 adenylate cyclase/predicted ATPase